MDRLFLQFSIDKLRQSVDRIEQCVARLSEDQVWWRADDSNNSIGNLLLHLSGNVRQWIISSIGGAPNIRQRDAEFAARGGDSPAQLVAKLKQTVEEATAVLDGVSAARLEERVKIQDYEMSVLEAIYHVVEHFTLHTGQIMFVTKLVTKQDLGFYKHLNQPSHNQATP